MGLRAGSGAAPARAGAWAGELCASGLGLSALLSGPGTWLASCVTKGVRPEVPLCMLGSVDVPVLDATVARPWVQALIRVAGAQRNPPRFTRREIVKLVGGTVALVVGWAVLFLGAWEYVRWTEDFLPGTPPTDVLEADAWEVTEESVTFAAVGDTGTGGRNQMDVAQSMVDTYKETPYGFVAHVGDVSYYGSIVDRWPEVWEEPYKPLLDANVVFQVALGNHELEEEASDDVARWIDERLAQFGYETTYRVVPYGPVDFFFLDTATPLMTGERSGEPRATAAGNPPGGYIHKSPFGCMSEDHRLAI